MRTFQRLTLALAVLSMFCGVVALADDPVPLAPKCNNLGNQGRGKGPIHHCDPLCFDPCEQVVCDGTGWCKWHCEPIPGCTPA
jgi:hypothetical protein